MIPASTSSASSPNCTRRGSGARRSLPSSLPPACRPASASRPPRSRCHGRGTTDRSALRTSS
eukprot:7212157-Prymnesium_polylepis.1